MPQHERSIFMELPTEIREMILRFLLVTPYTEIGYDSMGTKEYRLKKPYLYKEPDRTFQFFTAIMRTNRRVYTESVNLCQRENDFVCLTSAQPSWLGQRLKEHGLQTIAQGLRAHGFWNVAMTIKLDPAEFAGWPACRSSDSEDDRPWMYIFSIDEMPKFCRLLLKFNKHSNGHLLPNTTIHIRINDVLKGQPTDILRSAIGLSRMRRLLDPLHQLHSFGAAQVEGPLSSNYKDSHITSLCKDCPTAIEIIQTAVVILSQGDQEIDLERSSHAVQKYKLALSYVRSCCWLYDERDFVMDSGPFPGLTAAQTMRNLKVRLLARIASVHLNSGMLRIARIYLERVLYLHRTYGDRQYLRLSFPYAATTVYAEVLHVSAGISYAHGHVREALEDMDEAEDYRPFSKDEQCRYEAWKKHASTLYQKQSKRRESREKQRKKVIWKAEEKFSVACNWTEKGDRLLRRGRSKLATSTYQAALMKIGSLVVCPHWEVRSGKYQDYSIRDGIEVLRFRLQASVAASHLMSQRYKDALKWSDAALKYPLFLWGCEHKLEDRGDLFCRMCREGQRDDYIRAHYCCSRALMHMGDTSRAIEQMEMALALDPGNGNVAAQLVFLRRKLEKDRSGTGKREG